MTTPASSSRVQAYPQADMIAVTSESRLAELREDWELCRQSLQPRPIEPLE